MMNFEKTDALLVVDMQNDFMPWGSLPVPGGNEIIKGINLIAPQFGTIVPTAEAHDWDHPSFLEQGGQWPRHCIPGSHGAEFPTSLLPTIRLATAMFFKAHKVESYSAFIDNEGNESGLTGFLKSRGVKRVFHVGVAYEYCVSSTAIDCVKDFETYVIDDLCRGINQSSVEHTRAVLLNSGVKIV